MTQPSTLDTLAAYIAGALDRPLPPAVHEKTKHHVLDTIAAMVTGSRLKPGEAAIDFVRAQGGVQEAAVVGSNVVTTAINAAMANGMLAHSDETDDSHAPSLTHPGCAVVPAALAVAERQNASGEALLRAVALGYDVGSRIARLMGGIDARGMHGHATHTIGPMFGSTAAAAALVGLDPRGSPIRPLLHCTAGVGHNFLGPRLRAHREVVRVRRQRRAEWGHFRPLRGLRHDRRGGRLRRRERVPRRVLSKAGRVPRVGRLSRRSLRDHPYEHQEVLRRLAHPSGGRGHDVPRHGARRSPPATSGRSRCCSPPQGAQIVNGRHMPDVNLQYCMAAIALDGGKLTFEATHTYERMSDPDIVDFMGRVRLEGTSEFAGMERQRPATVRIHTANAVLELHVPAVRGTADSPMTTEEVDAKAADLIGSVYGEQRAKDVVAAVHALETTPAAVLRPLLTEP